MSAPCKCLAPTDHAVLQCCDCAPCSRGRSPGARGCQVTRRPCRDWRWGGRHESCSHALERLGAAASGTPAISEYACRASTRHCQCSAVVGPSGAWSRLRRRQRGLRQRICLPRNKRSCGALPHSPWDSGTRWICTLLLLCSAAQLDKALLTFSLRRWMRPALLAPAATVVCTAAT